MSKTARDIMTPHIKSVPESWPMQKFGHFLTENGITGSPVVDDLGEIVGIATLTDIADFHLNNVDPAHETDMSQDEQKEARRLRQSLFEEMVNMPVEVRDIMTPILVSVSEDTPTKEIARRMMEEHLHRIFVKSDSHVVGIITTFDILRLVAEGEL